MLVSAEDDAEVRRVSIANCGNRAREIDVTSYAELVLAPQADDVAHPAFMKLFVDTEYLAGQGTHPGDATAAMLRPSRRSGPRIWPSWMARRWASRRWKPTGRVSSAAATTSTGRSRSIDGRPLSNTVGTVLDPVFALRRRVRVAPGATVRIAFWTVVAESREAVLDLVDKHRDTNAFERAATLAWTQAQVQLHHLGIDPGEASLFQRLAGHLLYAGPALRPSSDTIRRGAAGQPGLWPMGISGDLPIVLLRIADIETSRHRAPTAASPRILADEAAGRGSRDPERTRVLLRAGSADRARDPGSGKPVAAAGRRRSTVRPGLRAAGRPDFAGSRARCSRRSRGSSWSGSAGRSPISSTACRNPHEGSRPAKRATISPCGGRRRRRTLPRRWSSSTGLAVLPTTGGNM